MRAMWLVALAIAGACKGDGAKPVTKVAQPTEAPRASFSTAELDAMWALAPETARFGVVVAPSGLAKLERAYAVIEKLAAAPELAEARAQMETTIAELFGTKSFSFAAAGMSTTQSWAYFQLINDETITILPVVDRDKFLAARGGTKGADGLDTLGVQTCKTVKGVYACTRSPNFLDQLGNGSLHEILKLAGARGDIEIAGVVPLLGMRGAAAIQLARGGLTLRGAVKNIPPRSRRMFANARPRPVTDAHSAFGVLGFGQWEILQKMPPAPLVAGVAADALMKTLEGPLTLTGDNGMEVFEVQLPLRDADLARKLVAACDQIPLLAQLGATIQNGTCHIPAPQGDLELDAWVDGTTLHFGKKGFVGKPPAVSLSPLARELANGDWSVALYGRGTLYGPTRLTMPLADTAGLRQKIGARGMATVNELGVGLRLEGDTLRGIVGVRTLWSNPDDVVAKLLAIDPDKILGGSAVALAKPVADGAPNAPFAADFKIGGTGLFLATGMVGVLFSVGVPAFFDTLKIERRPEAVTELERIGEGAAAVQATKGSFPKGTVGPSPAKSCCGTGNNRCLPDAATWSVPLWKTLAFAMTEQHLFRYAYESTDGKTFVATARSDLDCNGDEAVWTLTGKLDASGNPVTELVPPAKGHY
jgi:hypothetical protein